MASKRLAAKVLLWSLLTATILWGTSIYIARQDALVNSVHMPIDPEPLGTLRIGYHDDRIGFMEGDLKLALFTDNGDICFIDFDAKEQPESHCHPAVKGPTIP